MILRIIFVIFVSGASGICYLAGFTRIMSSLLIGFGMLAATFFGVIFVLPETSRELWFPIYGDGAAWPFFVLAFILAIMTGLVLTKRKEDVPAETLSSMHLQYTAAGFFTYLLSVLLSAFLWFPSDEKRLNLDPSTLGMYLFWGTCLYLVGTMVALFLFYRASKAAAENYPDLMRRVILALFAVLQFDKMPAFIAYLLIYSPETRIIYPTMAAFALAAYIPVGFFLLKLSWQSESQG